MIDLNSKRVGIFTRQLAYPCKSDPFREVSEIICKDGLISGDVIRISTFRKTKKGIREGRALVLITIP